MPQYLILGNFTEQGIKSMKNGPAMRQGAEQALAAKGGRMIASGLTFGEYDFFALLELPGDEVTLEMALTMAAQGMYRTKTLRVFPPAESDPITQRLP